MIPLATLLDERFAERAPLEGEPWVDADTCIDCHLEEGAQWQGTAHARAWTAPIFQASFQREPQPWCVWCHAPNPAQVAEVAANAAVRARLDPDVPPLAPLVFAPEVRASEGVNCAVCHLRHGTVHNTTTSGAAEHPSEAIDAYATMCRSCHEFRTPTFGGEGVTFEGPPMQSTWSEWEAWRAAGGRSWCVDCHMDGTHALSGPSDPAFVRKAVKVALAPEPGRWTFTVESVDVGHLVPTGDLFRRVTLDVESSRGWATIATFGRRFEDIVGAHGHPARVLAEDTSLRPGEPRRVTTEPGRRWRLVYHRVSDAEEARGVLPLEAVRVVIAESEGP